MNLPSTQIETLQPATVDELRAVLKALFAQFPVSDGNAEGKYLGYFMALEGEPKWAVERAARKFIRGEVAEHDGRFLPSSAELARIVRGYSDHARRIRDLKENLRPFRPIERVVPNTDRPDNPQMAARVRHVFSGAATVGIGDHPFPSMDEFRSWKLPTGTQIVAADGTVIYPNGVVEKWTSIQRRVGKQTAAEKPTQPDPLAVEVAVSPSPQTMEVMRRKEWLKKQEQEEKEKWGG